jgi:D-alanyl-D-alanine carboxypeptidase
MSDSMADSTILKLERRIATLLRQHHLPGTAVGVVRGQECVWSRGFGFADIASRRRPDADTLYRVASITKTFTATAVLQLRDDGRLRLDDPVVHHLPEFGRARLRFGSPEDITIRRLLSHRAGLITEGPFSYWDTLEFPTMADVLDRLAESEVVIEPDSASKYSNLAFALLGEVVARISGRPYEEYVRAEIFEPLGMTSSTFAPDGALRGQMATGYDPHPFEDEPVPAGHTSTRGITAAAGLYTTVHDLARWIALQFRTDAAERSGAQILSGRTIEEMHRPQDIDPTWTAARCLGWMAQRRGERIYHGHGGSIHGFITQVLFSKARRSGVIVLTNEGRHSAAGIIAAEMLETLLQADEGAEAVEWEPPAPTPAAMRRFLGRYEYWRGGLVHVEARNGTLVLALPPGVETSLHAPSPLEPTEQPHVFRVGAGRGAGELLTFNLAPDGEVDGFLLAGFSYAKLRGAGAPQTSPLVSEE